MVEYLYVAVARILLCFFVLLIIYTAEGTKICGSTPAALPRLSELYRRSVNTSVTDPPVRDSLLGKMWYSVDSGSGEYRLSSLSDGQPAPGHCGTLYPVFLKGTFPRLEEGNVVDLKVCLVGYGNPCEQEYDIKVRLCDGATQYYLVPTGGTSAYCFERTDATMIPAPNSLQRNPQVSVNLIYREFRGIMIPHLEFVCNFTLSASSIYFYSVSWYRNSHFLKHFEPKRYANINETNLLENHLLDSNISLGSYIKCGVKVSASLSGLQTNEQFSAPFFAGIEVDKQLVDLHRGQNATISVRQTVPVGCNYSVGIPDKVQRCAIALSTVDISEEYHEACSKNDTVIAALHSTHCGVELQGQKYSECHNGVCPQQSYGWKTITIAAINDYHAYETSKTFQLLLKTEKFNDGNKIWQDYRIQTVSVTMKDDQRWEGKICQTIADPQMLTFDKRLYQNQQINSEFILYRHKELQIEVQYKTAVCAMTASRSCICSVIIRAGGDMWAYTICNSVKFIGFLSCKEGILSIKSLSTERYQVMFPTGTYLEVKMNHMTGHLDISIFSSPSDTDKTEGHCGILNNDKTDDFKDRSGRVIADTSSFISSWRVHSDESFHHIQNQDPDVWHKSFYVCACQKLEGSLENTVRCSPAQTTLCTRQSSNTQKSVCSARRRRSLEYDRREIKRRFALLEDKSVEMYREKRSVDLDEAGTYESGLKQCLMFYQNQTLYDLRDALPESSKLNESLEACARDAMASKTDSPWTRSHFESWANAIGNEIQRNKTFSSTETAVVSAYIEALCPEDCNHNGFCLNGSCTCNPGYAGSTCFIRIAEPLIIEDIEGGGVCDVSKGDHCHSCHRFQTKYLLESFRCRIAVYQGVYNGTDILEDSFEKAGEYENLFEGYCCPSKVQARKRRSNDMAVFVTRYEISISNDGVNFGQSRNLYVYDSTCQEYQLAANGALVFTVKVGFCFIDGRCYTNGERASAVGCDVCNAHKNPLRWNSGCKATTPKSDPDTVVSAYQTVVIVSSSITSAVVIGVAIVAVLIWKHYRLKRRNVSTAKRNDYITPIDCLGDSVNTTGLHVPTQLGSLSSSTNMPPDQTPPAYATIVLPRTVSDSSRSVNTVSAEHPYDEVKDKSSYSQMDIRPTNAYLSLKPTLEKLV